MVSGTLAGGYERQRGILDVIGLGHIGGGMKSRRLRHGEIQLPLIIGGSSIIRIGICDGTQKWLWWTMVPGRKCRKHKRELPAQRHKNRDHH
jgi:hypothetical protein